ncbi:hypothetical protein K7X08_021501 [Anisodus acutangulus]|uniref:Inositol polyphosphate-related phosphatase domain-containing protein n=1 Tax=Anisodus acutangulus TaxID=402998 RepID=A0A9Q1RDW8_9SOLA|nr:hypothetical protein K7X08_021501 [Anisodus acutangulus]
MGWLRKWHGTDAGLEGNLLVGWVAHNGPIVKIIVRDNYLSSLATHGGIRGWSLASPGPIDNIIRPELAEKEHLYTRKSYVMCTALSLMSTVGRTGRKCHGEMVAARHRVRKSLRKHVGDLDVGAIACGLGRAIGNKLYSSVLPSILLLAVGVSSAAQMLRVTNAAAINPDEGKHDFAEADMLVFFSDFNYRLFGITYDEARDFVSQRSFDWLERDQLRAEMKVGKVFQGMREAIIRFSPTYKFERGKPGLGGYDFGEKKRILAWCDRVLYRDNRTSPAAECGLGCPVVASIIQYEGCIEVTESDHNPSLSFKLYFLGTESVSLLQAMTFIDSSIQVTPTSGIIKPDQAAEILVRHEDSQSLKDSVDGVSQSWWSEDTRDREVTLMINIKASQPTEVRTHQVHVRHSFSADALRVNSKNSERSNQGSSHHRSALKHVGSTSNKMKDHQNIRVP